MWPTELAAVCGYVCMYVQIGANARFMYSILYICLCTVEGTSISLQPQYIIHLKPSESCFRMSKR